MVWTGLLSAERGTWQGSSTGGPAPTVTWHVALTTHQADLEPPKALCEGLTCVSSADSLHVSVIYMWEADDTCALTRGQATLREACGPHWTQLRACRPPAPMRG